MHKKKKIHRALKCDRILMNKKGEIEIADKAGRQHKKSVVGTPAWMSQNQYSNRIIMRRLIYGVHNCDRLAMGEPPYLRVPPPKAMYSIPANDTPRLPKKFQKPFHEFIEKILDKNSRRRLSTKDALTLRFFKNQNRDNVRQMIENKKTFHSIIQLSKPNNEIFYQFMYFKQVRQYKYKKVLGNGSYANAYLVEDGKHEYAMKDIKIDLDDPENESNQKMMEYFEQEITIYIKMIVFLESKLLHQTP